MPTSTLTKLYFVQVTCMQFSTFFVCVQICSVEGGASARRSHRGYFVPILSADIMRIDTGPERLQRQTSVCHRLDDSQFNVLSGSDSRTDRPYSTYDHTLTLLTCPSTSGRLIGTTTSLAASNLNPCPFLTPTRRMSSKYLRSGRRDLNHIQPSTFFRPTIY